MLDRLAREGLARRYGDPPPAAAVERLEFELGVIREMGFESYFLIVWDFVRYAKESGIAVGPGRGSAAGSIVSYALNITDLDPLANGLLFERFLNPARKSMPDIDIDFSVRGRERVIRYVQEKYGRESVAQIITFGKMAPRAATRDAARARLRLRHRGPRGQADLRADHGPQPQLRGLPAPGPGPAPGPRRRRGRPADRRRRPGPRGNRPQQLDPRRRRGDRRSTVERDRPAPASEDRSGAGAPNGNGGEREARTLLQDRHPVLDGPIEEIGLLKMDFLGRNLDGSRTPSRSSAARAAELDIEAIPMDDERTYEMLARGDSVGVFQLESDGMRDAL